MNILVGDFETSTGNSDGSTNVYLWGISSRNKEDRYSGVNLKEFFDCIYEYKLTNIFFHNLSFDGKFIVHWLIKNNIHFENIKFGERLSANTFTWLCDEMGTIYNMRVNYKGHIIKFGDTAKLLNSSVDKLGEVLGIPKLEIDYHKYKHFDSIDDVPDKLIEYLWRDIDIVIDTYNIFCETYKNHGITLGGTAYKDFKKEYGLYNFTQDFGGKWYDRRTKKTYNNKIFTLEEWEELKKGYKGGLVLYNVKLKGKVIKCGVLGGHSYDFKSLYPYIMKNFKLPYGKPMKVKPIHSDYVVLYKIYIEKAVKKDLDMPNHLHDNYSKVRRGDKYLSEVEDEYYTYTEMELEELKKTYDIKFDIIDTWYFYAKYIFTDWISNKMHLKNNAKNEVDRLYHKVVQNSLYGKFGQNPIRAKRLIVYDPEQLRPGTRYGKNREYVESKVVEESETLSYIPLALFITSYARCHLLKAVRPNKKQFIYGDTDSIYLKGKAQGIKIGGEEYGDLIPELRYDKFMFIKPKAYIARLLAEYKNGEYEDCKKGTIKRAIAGLSKENHSKLNFSNFKSGYVLPIGKKQKRNVDGGIILVDVKYTL